MITIDNVISIDGSDEFAGSQSLDPASIVYLAENSDDTTQTYLYEEQKGGFPLRVWLIDDAIATVVSNAVTDTGYEVLITAVAGTIDNRNASQLEGTYSVNPARIYQMTDDASDNALIRLWADNVQGFEEFVLEETSANIAAEANTTITQIETGLVSAVNDIDLPESKTFYWATAVVEKVVPARTGYSDATTPEQVFISTYNSQKIVYTIDAGASS